MHPSIDLYPGIFSPRPYDISQRTMFSLGCSCGRAASQTPLPQRQQDCFSYVVSIDGIHVCHPQNIIEHETAEEDGPGSDQQNLVEYDRVEAAGPGRECAFSLLQRRGRSISRMRLALSALTQSTLVSLSGYRAGECNADDRPHPEGGDYELIKQIGMDGEGIIHLMRSRSARQLVVRKTVTYARSCNAKPIEAAILQDIFPERHNNIIRLHAFESYEVEGARYWLEFCSGGDLYQLVDRYEKEDVILPEPFIWQAFQQLASALEFLHRGFDPRRSDPDRRGICHRDIKPSNIFLRPVPNSTYPDVVLGDFGHATLDFATYDPAGTDLWQPPELPRHSPKGDVYCLGAVMHFLIHFKVPVAKLPDGVPNTESAKDVWSSAPEARQPIMEFVDEYSEELICVMLIALEADENKRKNSSQLLKFVSECIEEKFPPGSDLLTKAKEWPMASWAFDHMGHASGRFEEEECEDAGTEQYLDMMERFGCGRSRESSRSSSPAPSDWRRGMLRGAREGGRRRLFLHLVRRIECNCFRD